MIFKIGDYIQTNTDKYIVTDDGFNKIALVSLVSFISYKIDEGESIKSWLEESEEKIVVHTDFRDFTLYVP